ncbi:small multi-drug export protein [Sporosarcina sp.]|uniref:small multi-drug export protein n=1 Tax=Sporosarcina sp. TaxID=49982 RepID=UPI00261E9FB0|nr:small multi-drug export protein [Sporosarcina sp.]
MFTYLLVFFAAAVPGIEILVAVPLGIVRGLSPIVAIIVGFLGNASTIILEILIFQRLKTWWDSRKTKDVNMPSKRTARAESIWQRYGVPGLSLLGPILIGSHLAAFLALALGSSKQQTAMWLFISLAIWSIIYGVLTVLGVDAFFWTRKQFE